MKRRHLIVPALLALVLLAAVAAAAAGAERQHLVRPVLQRPELVCAVGGDVQLVH